MDHKSALAFHEVAAETHRKLQVLWDEIGTSQEERQEHMRKLMHDLTLLFHGALKAEQVAKDQLMSSILRMLDDMLGICAALGEELEMEDLGGLPLRQRSAAVKQKMDLFEQKRNERLAELHTLQHRHIELCEQLGVEPSPALEEIGNDLSRDRIAEFNAEISRLYTEKTNRQVQVQNLVAEIRGLWEELCTDAAKSDEFDKAVRKGDVPPTPSSISRLQEKKDRLLEEKQFREDVVKEHARSIMALWEQLSVPEAEREAFLTRHNGLGPEVLDACRTEKKRLENLKAASMKQLIGDARSKIVELWNELHLSEEERRTFCAAYSSDYNDDTLRAHHEEINKLQLKLKEYKPIIIMIERREQIKHERDELEASAQDKSRLLSKSSGSHHLLREEKVRRMVTKELPKIDEKLKATLTQWESMYGQPFLYHGAHYLRVIEDDAAFEQAKKDKLKQQRDISRNRRMGNIGINSQPVPKPAPQPTVRIVAAKTPVAALRRPPLTPSNRMESPMVHTPEAHRAHF